MRFVPAADEAGVCVQRSEHRVDHPGRELVLEIPLGARVAVSAQLVDREPVGDDRVVAVGDHVCVARERVLLLGAFSVSTVGDWLFRLALPLLVLHT